MSIQRNNPDITPHTYAYTRSAWLTSRAAGLIDAKRYDDARRDCEEAISIAPFNHMAYIKLGIVYSYAGDINRAIEEIKKAPHYTQDPLFGEREDNRLDILYFMWMLYAKNGNYDEAFKCATTALTLPSNESLVSEDIQREIFGDNHNNYDKEAREQMQQFVKLYKEEKSNGIF